jgi:hypothetical protein
LRDPFSLHTARLHVIDEFLPHRVIASLPDGGAEAFNLLFGPAEVLERIQPINSRYAEVGRTMNKRLASVELADDFFKGSNPDKNCGLCIQKLDKLRKIFYDITVSISGMTGAAWKNSSKRRFCLWMMKRVF